MAEKICRESIETGVVYAFDGKIDEVRIYNRALTDGEIRDIYDGS